MEQKTKKETWNIYVELQQLLHEVYRALFGMPKKDRVVLGDRIMSAATDALTYYNLAYKFMESRDQPKEREENMEQFAIDTINNGGALGVLFVLFLLGFGWCYFKIKGHDVRLNEGDSTMKEMLKLITDIRIDVAVMRGKKEDEEKERK